MGIWGSKYGTKMELKTVEPKWGSEKMEEIKLGTKLTHEKQDRGPNFTETT